MHASRYTPPKSRGFRPGHEPAARIAAAPRQSSSASSSSSSSSAPGQRPAPRSERPNDRRLRQLDYFHRLADRAMRIADLSADAIEAHHAAGESQEIISACVLDFARASRALVLAVSAENRVLSGNAPLRAPANDERRPLLIEALSDAVRRTVADKPVRDGLLRDVNERVEDTLVADPDAEIGIAAHLATLANELNIKLDPSKLSDAVLGMPPRTPHPLYGTRPEEAARKP